jgi:thiamine biosynthesis lipoprotein
MKKGTISILMILLFNQCTVQQKEDNQLQRYTFSAPKMGTTFHLTFYTHSHGHAEKVSQLVWNRIDKLEIIFSDYQSNSEASIISNTAGTGQKIKVSDEMWEVLQIADTISKISNGAFDVTIGALSKLWRKAIRQQKFPDEKDILTYKATVGYKSIDYFPKEQAVRLNKKGTRLDFGGIAKGYALDEAMIILRNNGIKSALVDGGGDIICSEKPPTRKPKPWKILLLESKELELYSSNSAIFVSGDTYKFLEVEDKKYTHIIDPKTGKGVQNANLVLVSSSEDYNKIEDKPIFNPRKATYADALASTCVVTGKKIRWHKTIIDIFREFDFE